MDSHKIEAVKQWPRPTSTTDIRSVIDLAVYYRRFVEAFSSIASPLTGLTKRQSSFNGQMIVRKTSHNRKLDLLQLLSLLYQWVQMVM